MAFLVLHDSPARELRREPRARILRSARLQHGSHAQRAVWRARLCQGPKDLEDFQRAPHNVSMLLHKIICKVLPGLGIIKHLLYSPKSCALVFYENMTQNMQTYELEP